MIRRGSTLRAGRAASLLTFETVRELARRYRTSLTATALGLVRHGPVPCIIVASRLGQRFKWFRRSPDAPRAISASMLVEPKWVALR